MERIHVTRAERLARARTATRREPAAACSLQRMAGNRAVCHLLRCKDKKAKRQSSAQIQAEQMRQKSAPNQTPIAFSKLPAAAQGALRAILAGDERDYLRPGGRQAQHRSRDRAAEGSGRRRPRVPHRALQRVVPARRPHQGQGQVRLLDPKHTAGTYTYHRVIDPPFPALAPAPAPAPLAPAPAPLPVAAAGPPVAMPAAATPVPSSWDD